MFCFSVIVLKDPPPAGCRWIHAGSFSFLFSKLDTVRVESKFRIVAHLYNVIHKLMEYNKYLHKTLNNTFLSHCNDALSELITHIHT